MDCIRAFAIGLSLVSLAYGGVANAQTSDARQSRFGVTRAVSSDLEGKLAREAIFLAPDFSDGAPTTTNELSYRPSAVSAPVANYALENPAAPPVTTNAASSASAQPGVGASAAPKTARTSQPRHRQTYTIDAPSTLSALKDSTSPEQVKARRDFYDKIKANKEANAIPPTPKFAPPTTESAPETPAVPTTEPTLEELAAPINTEGLSISDVSPTADEALDALNDSAFDAAAKEAASTQIDGSAPGNELGPIFTQSELPQTDALNASSALEAPSQNAAIPTTETNPAPIDLGTLPQNVEIPTPDPAPIPIEPEAPPQDAPVPMTESSAAPIGLPTESAAVPPKASTPGEPKVVKQGPKVPDTIGKDAPKPMPELETAPEPNGFAPQAIPNEPLAERPRRTHTRPIVAPTLIPKQGYRIHAGDPETQPQATAASASTCASCASYGYVPGMGLAAVVMPTTSAPNGAYVYQQPYGSPTPSTGSAFFDPTTGVYYNPVDAARARNCSDPIQPSVRCFTCAAEANAACSTCSAAPGAILTPPPSCARDNAAAWEMKTPEGYEYALYDDEYPGVTESFDEPCRVMSGLIADVEWLGWQTDRGDNNYAGFVSPRGDVYDRTISPSGSGLRAKIGFRGLSGWDIIGSYTYFDADKSRSTSDVSGSGSWRNPWGFDPRASVDSISASASVDLDVYDIEAGRWNWNGLSGLRPFIGFRWTQLTETVASASSIGAVSESAAARSKLNAYGLRLGLEWKRDLIGNLQVYAKGGGTVGVGDVVSSDIRTRDGGCFVDRRDVKNTYGTSAIEAAAGLAWKRGNFEAHGGYEFNDWFCASRIGDKASDFIVHGWVVGIGWNR